MALIKCPECGKEISDKSTVCIHCGYPLQEQESQSQQPQPQQPQPQQDAAKDQIVCPECGSTNVATNWPGLGAMMGMIGGSGQKMNRCNVCGYQWRTNRRW